MVAFRRPKCLKDILVHSELKTPVNIKGCVKCTDKRCRVCDYLVEGTRFSSGVTGKSYIINFNMGCNSDHVIYVISCTRCAMQYVGSTINKLRIRFNNQKSRLNSHVKLTTVNRVKDDIIYKHFNQPDHQGLRDVRIQLIDKGSNERSLREREAQWAYRLRTIYPSGLNSDDFFCPRRALL